MGQPESAPPPVVDNARERLRRLPAVSRVLDILAHEPAAMGVAPEVLTELVRQELDERRRAVLAGAAPPTVETVATAVQRRLGALFQPSLQPVINATGVILHTNLGRAPLSRDTIAAMEQAARGYTNLEYDLETGERGSRHVHPAALLQELTGAEDALVVNNNAAAVLLALTALAQGREVLVSRGQAVEIGGGVRIPEVLAQSGAILREVGTTNRTYLRDYAAALGDHTALILRVHASNFRLIGFVHETPLEELVGLGNSHRVPVLDDLGSGSLLDTACFGLAREPMVQESVQAGAGLVCFSGDKLLGGPQSGVIAGRRELVERLRRHPLTRAIRPDKVTIAGLVATLQHYRRGDAVAHVPVWRMLATPLEALQRRATGWQEALAAHGVGLECQVVAGCSAVGGGSLPGETLPTALLAVWVPGTGAGELAARLRRGTPPVVARVDHDRLLLDPRTVAPEDDPVLLEALAQMRASSTG
jgi:L-seryl-tRNA(Ser) seleniumtransferase